MKVVAAAIKVRQEIFTAKRHADIYEQLAEKRIDAHNAVEGFVTDDNTFVDRYEAKKIAVAANQLIVPEEDTYAALYSEDVW